ncbi:unnamed protein product [marine sediment metagenome]|uniref:Uncharacterized protein n=1 Tax=marine sediment metagenome TaxID=412755 RepID=X1SDC8_9ZZZZ
MGHKVEENLLKQVQINNPVNPVSAVTSDKNTPPLPNSEVGNTQVAKPDAIAINSGSNGVEKPSFRQEQNAPVPTQQGETLEIEPSEDNPATPKAENQKEIFRCPECNEIVEQYQDCKNPECLAEIIWQED